MSLTESMVAGIRYKHKAKTTNRKVQTATAQGLEHLDAAEALAKTNVSKQRRDKIREQLQAKEIVTEYETVMEEKRHEIEEPPPPRQPLSSWQSLLVFIGVRRAEPDPKPVRKTVTTVHEVQKPVQREVARPQFGEYTALVREVDMQVKDVNDKRAKFTQTRQDIDESIGSAVPECEASKLKAEDKRDLTIYWGVAWLIILLVLAFASYKYGLPWLNDKLPLFLKQAGLAWFFGVLGLPSWLLTDDVLKLPGPVLAVLVIATLILIALLLCRKVARYQDSANNYNSAGETFKRCEETNHTLEETSRPVQNKVDRVRANVEQLKKTRRTSSNIGNIDAHLDDLSWNLGEVRVVADGSRATLESKYKEHQQ